MNLQKLDLTRATPNPSNPPPAVTAFGAKGLAYHAIPEIGRGAWGVTHVRSGARLHAHPVSRQQARELVLLLLESDIDWTLEAGKMDLAAAYKVVRAALDTVGAR